MTQVNLKLSQDLVEMLDTFLTEQKRQAPAAAKLTRHGCALYLLRQALVRATKKSARKQAAI